jgi:hypothetical protein
MVDDSRAGETGSSDGIHWTVQQFATVAVKPWFALQKHNDSGVIWQATGYRHEVDELCTKQDITPQELEPIDEEEFYRRFQNDEPEDDPLNFPMPQP